MTTKLQTKCGCDSGFKMCPLAERLWREANNIYHSQDYDAWKDSKAFADYQAHMKEVYDQEHLYFKSPVLRG